MHPAAPPLFFVFNAASGQDDTARLLPLVQARLQAAGRAGDGFVAHQPGELNAVIGRAVNAAREARGAVVAVGGDGTLNTVAQAAWNANLVLGVLPQGHCNFFARALGMPLQPEPALQALLQARSEPMPVGMVGERLFLVHASVGLYPPLLAAQEQAPPGTGHQPWASRWASLGTLLRGGSLMTLELHAHGEARVVRTRTLHVGHNALQLRALGLRQAPAATDGRLAATTLLPLPAWRTLWRVLRGSIGRLDSAQRVDRFAFEQLQVRPRRRQPHMPVAIDGETLWLPTPLVFQAAPHPLQVLVPRRGDGPDGEGSAGLA